MPILNIRKLLFYGHVHVSPNYREPGCIYFARSVDLLYVNFKDCSFRKIPVSCEQVALRAVSYSEYTNELLLIGLYRETGDFITLCSSNVGDANPTWQTDSSLENMSQKQYWLQQLVPYKQGFVCAFVEGMSKNIAEIRYYEPMRNHIEPLAVDIDKQYLADARILSTAKYLYIVSYRNDQIFVIDQEGEVAGSMPLPDGMKVSSCPEGLFFYEYRKSKAHIWSVGMDGELFLAKSIKTGKLGREFLDFYMYSDSSLVMPRYLVEFLHYPAQLSEGELYLLEFIFDEELYITPSSRLKFPFIFTGEGRRVQRALKKLSVSGLTSEILADDYKFYNYYSDSLGLRK